MIPTKRLFRSTLLATLLCGSATVSLLAQGPGGPPPGGPGGRHHGPPAGGPLFDALDTNHDGVLSADEMANATASLKSLLKNGATQLTHEDLRPMHPPQHAEAGDQRDQPDAADAEAGRPGPKGIRPHGPPPREQAANDDGPDAAGKPEGGNNHGHHGPPPSPLFDALDTNHDGTISSDEMGAASASLKTLLKTGSTELRREDLRPVHPPQRQMD